MRFIEKNEVGDILTNEACVELANSLNLSDKDQQGARQFQEVPRPKGERLLFFMLHSMYSTGGNVDI